MQPSQILSSTLYSNITVILGRKYFKVIIKQKRFLFNADIYICLTRPPPLPPPLPLIRSCLLLGHPLPHSGSGHPLWMAPCNSPFSSLSRLYYVFEHNFVILKFHCFTLLLNFIIVLPNIASSEVLSRHAW